MRSTPVSPPVEGPTADAREPKLTNPETTSAATPVTRRPRPTRDIVPTPESATARAAISQGYHATRVITVRPTPSGDETGLSPINRSRCNPSTGTAVLSLATLMGPADCHGQGTT